MKSKSTVIDEIVLQKNKLIENLNLDERKEIDIYLDQLLKELEPALNIFDKMSSNEEARKNIADAFKSEIEEQKWLEKLSKTFYDQAGIQDPTKIQKE